VHAGSWEQYATEFGPGNANFFVGPNENYWGTCNGCNGSGVPSAAPFTTTNNQVGYARIKTNGVTLKYTADFTGMTFTAIGDYSTLTKQYQEDSDVSPYTVFQFFNGSDVKQKSLELRVNGGDKALNWTAGVYGLQIDGNYYEGWQGPAFFGAEQFNTDTNPNAAYSGWTFSPGPWPWSTTPATAFPSYLTGALPDPATGGLPATRSPYELTTKTYAVFGQVEYRLTDLIGLTVGARFTGDKKDYTFSWGPYEYIPGSLTNATIPLTRPVSLTLAQDYVNSRSDNLVAGKAQLDFHLAPKQLLYVSYNRGVKGGGFTAPLFPATVQFITDMTFKPEVLTSYEVGLKSEFLDRTLRLNSAVYYYDYKDYQALVYTVALNQLVKNADATHKGAETELEWVPNDAWHLGLGVSYVDAIVKHVDSRGTGVLGDWVPPNAPRWSGNALIRYTLPVGTGKLSLQADGNYLARFWFNLGDYPAVEQPAYGVGNARVSYVPASGKVEIGVAVENVADKHYGLMGFDNTAVNGLAQRYPGMPRWFKAHVNYRF
jgi:iron complex outermembrane receptor protein